MSKWLQFHQTKAGTFIDLRQFIGMVPAKELYCRHCCKLVKAFGPAACNAKKRPDRQWLIAPTWMRLKCFCSECGWLFQTKPIPGHIKSRVEALDNNECVYCGTVGTLAAPLTCDHVVPQLLGGGETTENIVLACSYCNSAKGAKASWYKPTHGRFKAVQT